MLPAGRRGLFCLVVWTFAVAGASAGTWSGACPEARTAAWSGAGPGSRPDSFPPSIRSGAWRLEEARSYAGEQLFELIDGGAPLYFEYGFLRAVAARYRCAAGGEVAVECYQMRTVDGAWGLWSYLGAGAGDPVMLGDTAVAGGGYLLVQAAERFWSFTALDGSGTDSLPALAGSFVGGRTGSGAVPSPVREFMLAFPAAEEPVLFSGPLGLQRRVMFVPDRRMRIPPGVSARIAGGEVVMFGHTSARDAEDQFDSLTVVLRMKKEQSPEGDVLAVGAAGADVLLAAHRGDRVVVLSGRDRDRLIRVWREARERIPRR